MNENSPIFIHAWWRSSSTYVWSKLRQDISLKCFYEPLHEQIAALNETTIQLGPQIKMNQMLRHPVADKNYYFEYLSLIRSNSLQYAPDLAYERYLLHPDQSDIKLYTYISGLISAASNEARRAVLCFCRSQMRSSWMKRNFVGIHIAQLRNPNDQWLSFQVNPYFTSRMISLALALRKIHPDAFTHIHDFERQAHDASLRNTSSGARGIQIQLNRRDCFRIFMVIWIASALQSIASADFVLDIDSLSTGASYRNSAARYFESLGCTVDFSDCLVPNSRGTNTMSDEVEELMKEAAKAIQFNAKPLVITDVDVIAKRLPTLAHSSRRILSLTIGSK